MNPIGNQEQEKDQSGKGDGIPFKEKFFDEQKMFVANDLDDTQKVGF